MMPARDNWLLRLQELVERSPHLGVIADLPTLTLIELWGIYCYLSRME
jgi:hypothetical protein